MRFRLLIGLPFMAAACSSSGPAATDPTTNSGGGTGSTSLSAYYLKPALCNDAAGSDCTKLHLGDAFFSTSGATRGSMYSCIAKNPNAPGSNSSKITWINTAAGTWNILEKPWLPAATGTPSAGTFAMTVSGSRSIQVNNLPVDQRIGNWPMTAYPLLTAIDPNPGIPAAKNFSFDFVLSPSPAAVPTCLSLGAIGVTLNGVVLYNAADARGDDAVAHEIVDVYGGHPAASDYHYHFIPERLDGNRLTDGHSGIVGYIRDGFPIYGYYGAGGVRVSNADLDECHGHAHGTLGYHYHATLDYPYTVGCYRGTPK